jgi:hypothetical protein
MNTSYHHRKFISGLLLFCSIVSLLFYLQLRYLPTPFDFDHRGVGASLSDRQSVIQMYEMFTAGRLEHHPFMHFGGSFVPAILVLTAGLAVWNYPDSKLEANAKSGRSEPPDDARVSWWTQAARVAGPDR